MTDLYAQALSLYVLLVQYNTTSCYHTIPGQNR